MTSFKSGHLISKYVFKYLWYSFLILIFISYLNALFSAITSVFFSVFQLYWGFQWLSLRSLLVNVTLPLKNMWIIFKYLLILISNIIPQWWENRLCMISIPLNNEVCASWFISLDMFQCLLIYSLWELEFVSYCCVKIVYILIILNWFMVLFRSTISFSFSVYTFC